MLGDGQKADWERGKGIAPPRGERRKDTSSKRKEGEGA